MYVFDLFTLVDYRTKHTYTHHKQQSTIKQQIDWPNDMRFRYFYYSDDCEKRFSHVAISTKEKQKQKRNQARERKIRKNWPWNVWCSSWVDGGHIEMWCVLFAFTVCCFCLFHVRSWICSTPLAGKQTNKCLYMRINRNQHTYKHKCSAISVLFGKPKNVKHTVKFVATQWKQPQMWFVSFPSI